MNLTLNYVLATWVVLGNHEDLIALEVNAGIPKFELFVTVDSFFKFVSCRGVVDSDRSFILNDYIVLL